MINREKIIGNKGQSLILILLLVLLMIYGACQGQTEEQAKRATLVNHRFDPSGRESSDSNLLLSIGAPVSKVFEDRNGDFWLGTYNQGLIHYDGNKLQHFYVKDGIAGQEIRGIVEDQEGNLWLATSGGLSRYDGHSFRNYTEADGLAHHDVWSIAIDREGTIWLGTLEGVNRFDGHSFSPFALPEAKIDSSRRVSSPKIVHCIIEDSQGRIWFGTNGGAYIYNPDTDQAGGKLNRLSEEDGLCSNAVNAILEDRKGNFWFATQHKGVCRYDGKRFEQITTKTAHEGKNTASSLHEDRAGNIWFPIEGVGVHQYSPSAAAAGKKALSNYFGEQHCISHTLRYAFEDREGRLWFSGWMGLFLFN